MPPTPSPSFLSSPAGSSLVSSFLDARSLSSSSSSGLQFSISSSLSLPSIGSATTRASGMSSTARTTDGGVSRDVFLGVLCGLLSLVVIQGLVLALTLIMLRRARNDINRMKLKQHADDVLPSDCGPACGESGDEANEKYRQPMFQSIHSVLSYDVAPSPASPSKPSRPSGPSPLHRRALSVPSQAATWSAAAPPPAQGTATPGNVHPTRAASADSIPRVATTTTAAAGAVARARLMPTLTSSSECESCGFGAFGDNDGDGSGSGSARRSSSLSSSTSTSEESSTTIESRLSSSVSGSPSTRGRSRRESHITSESKCPGSNGASERPQSRDSPLIVSRAGSNCQHKADAAEWPPVARCESPTPFAATTADGADEAPLTPPAPAFSRKTSTASMSATSRMTTATSASANGFASARSDSPRSFFTEMLE